MNDLFNELENILNETKFRKNYNRYNVMFDKPSDYCVYENGKKRFIVKSIPCLSLSFGITKKYFKKNSGYREMKDNEIYPLLYQKSKELMKKYNPDFDFTNITINKNLVCKKHKDKNTTDSYILFLGDYQGGGLNINDMKFTSTREFFKFNGRNEHWNDEIISGTKYSLVFMGK